MPITDTPLRYPGGKSQLTPVIVDILSRNNMLYGEYAEPFAGGAGIAMTLLLTDYVSRIYLNDVDPAIRPAVAGVMMHGINMLGAEDTGTGYQPSYCGAKAPQRSLCG